MKTIKIFLFSVIISTGNLMCLGNDNGILAIIGAFGAEIQLLNSRLTDKQEISILGNNFVKGKLHGQSVVLAKTGMGKVNAAMTTTIIIDRFQPRAIIFSGIAGGITAAQHPGDVIIGEKLLQHDYGTAGTAGFKTEPTVDPVTEKNNPLWFQADPQLLQLAIQAGKQTPLQPLNNRQPTIQTGIIVTGDAFVASAAKCTELSKSFHAAAVEMEGAAIAQICYQQKCPLIIIRSISDNANNQAEQDVIKFYQTAATNSAELVSTIIKLIKQNHN